MHIVGKLTRKEWMSIASLVADRLLAVDHGFGLNPDNFSEDDGETMLKVRG